MPEIRVFMSMASLMEVLRYVLFHIREYIYLRKKKKKKISGVA